MTNRKKEIAKFFSGAEALHAAVNAYFWLSGSTLTFFSSITVSPSIFALTALVHAGIAVALGLYAWRPATPG